MVHSRQSRPTTQTQVSKCTNLLKILTVQWVQINADFHVRLQLTVPLPMRASGVRGPRTDGVSIVGGEQPPPDPSECGRMASSRMWSVGILVVSSEWKQWIFYLFIKGSCLLHTASMCSLPSAVLTCWSCQTLIPFRQSASHFPSGDASLGEAHLCDIYREDDWRKLHCFHLPTLWVSPVLIKHFYSIIN